MDCLTLPPLIDRPARVLVAIGDEDTRAGVVEALSVRGHVVAEADEAAGVLERVRCTLPDLVILESALDDGQGLEVLGDLRMHDPMRLMPVMLLSSEEVDEEDVVRCLLAGADDHLTGTGRMRELVARVDVQLRNRRDRDLLRTAQKERVRLLDDAMTDPLTGVGNRRAADGALARALDGAETVLFMVIDVDHFKRINDGYGHPAGDEVLRALGRCLMRIARDGDAIARYGGEEFLVVIRDAPERSHGAIADRFLQGIRGLRLPVGAGATRITASIGAASWSREAWQVRSIALGMPPIIDPPREWDGETGGRALFELADRCLYQAKRGGRDAVVLARAASDEEAPLVTPAVRNRENAA
jgi:two-component system cell cycle response regulator